MANEEVTRLQKAREQGSSELWLRWGPYLSEWQWATVREDYSAGGNAWSYFPHDQARWRAYRRGEDGLAGLCDEEQKICFAIALWNGQDPILKERLFGLTNSEGNPRVLRGVLRNRIPYRLGSPSEPRSDRKQPVAAIGLDLRDAGWQAPSVRWNDNVPKRRSVEEVRAFL
jgi:hypothetical protein